MDKKCQDILVPTLDTMMKAWVFQRPNLTYHTQANLTKIQ